MIISKRHWQKRAKPREKQRHDGDANGATHEEHRRADHMEDDGYKEDQEREERDVVDARLER